MKNPKIYMVLLLIGFSLFLSAQEPKKVIHDALEQEMTRNLKNLHLDGMKDPFFIGTNIVDGNSIGIQSTLGKTIRVFESPSRFACNMRLLVGDYTANNLNFTDFNSYMSSLGEFLPLDNSLLGLKRSLWMMYDRMYKGSAANYESKQSAIKSKTQDEDIVGLEDYTKGTKVEVDKPEISLAFDSEKLTQYANAVSAAFKAYPSLVGSSSTMDGIRANIYYQNTEGTRATYPLSVIRLYIQAEIQASNGEPLMLTRSFFASDASGLPSKEQAIKEAKDLAEQLIKLKDAPTFDDVYNGPVLFEDAAACQTIQETMFPYVPREGLVSVRKQVVANEGGSARQNSFSTEDRLDKKITNENLSVVATPLMTSFNGQELMGSYPIDMEGTVPPEKTILVENGILKNQLCGRIPTRKMKESNGHMRGIVSVMPSMSICPGVIKVDFKAAVSKEELRKKLLEMAKEEGMNYALIVRGSSWSGSEIKMVYKVDVNTGAETLVRTAGFKGLTINDLRKLVGASNQQIVLNLLSNPAFGAGNRNLQVGSPVSYIVPDALLYRELEVSKVNKTNLSKLPVVKNPLEL